MWAGRRRQRIEEHIVIAVDPSAVGAWVAAVAVILFAFGIAFAVGASARSSRRKLKEAVARLRQQGYSVVGGMATAPSFPFEEFSKRRATTGLHITQPGTYDTAFHYEYTIKLGDDKERTIRLSCAVVPVPFASPRLSIWKGPRTILGRVAGSPRVDTDSERFNTYYEVECADERFAYTMLSYEVIEWFLNEPALSSGVKVRISHNWMLLVAPRVEHHQLPGMLVMAQLLRDRMPDVLTSMYPVRR